MRLEAKDVNISISGKPIVQHLSIEVPDRKFSALLGANGSGKTTLLRSIYRTQKMDSGIVRLDDEDITHFSGKKLARNMAVMGQFNQINFDYTVLDIALMGRYPFHSLLEQEKERDYEMALEALDKVGMKNYRDRNFQSLSGGEKQRVVLARALTLQIYDADGNAVDMTYDHAPEKVLSTQLSMTELLIKLGLKDKIVGVFDNDNALKGDIADEVASLNSLGDKKSVSKETILATEPDLILGKGPLMFTESSIGTVQSYQELGIPVYTELASASIDQSLDNIVEDVRNIGEIFNVQETANAYADELQERIDALMDKVSGQSGEPLKVLFMAGYADGTFVAFNSKMSSCMLNALNAENVLDKGGNGLTLENLVSMNPDIIVYVRADRFGSTDADAVEQLTSNAVVQEVPAIANQKVIEMDYDDVMDYGARVIDSAETLYNFMYSAS